MINRLIGIGALMMLAGSAQASFFSFSSDRNTDGPTFSSLSGKSVSDGRPFDVTGKVTIDFMYDADENGPGAATIIPASFEFDATATSYAVTPFAGSFIHSWTLAGTYKFTELTTGTTFFSAAFGNALMTNFSDSSTLLSLSGSILSNKPADGSLAFATAGALAGVDVSGGQDFSFSLSAFRSAANGGRVGVAADGSFLSQWKSEGSWSAHAVPAPGALALIGLGGLMLAKRKRGV